MTTDATPTRKECSFERLLREFKEWAATKLDDCPEARTLQLIVDWEVGQSDFPAGATVGRELSSAALLGCVRQLARAIEERGQAIRMMAEKATAMTKITDKPTEAP